MWGIILVECGNRFASCKLLVVFYTLPFSTTSIDWWPDSGTPPASRVSSSWSFVNTRKFVFEVFSSWCFCSSFSCPRRCKLCRGSTGRKSSKLCPHSHTCPYSKKSSFSRSWWSSWLLTSATFEPCKKPKISSSSVQLPFQPFFKLCRAGFYRIVEEFACFRKDIFNQVCLHSLWCDFLISHWRRLSWSAFACPTATFYDISEEIRRDGEKSYLINEFAIVA